MFVVISDLHLTDGTSAASVHPGAIHLFIQQLSEMAERAGWRSGNRYRPIESIDLILLGDTLDIINSRRWLDSGSRPWNHSGSPELRQTVSDIVDDLLRNNHAALQLLRSLSGANVIAVPTANQAGQAVSDESQSVDLRIHYMVGNRDWLLRLPGQPYNEIRGRIVRELGLANDATKPFPHDIAESDSLLEAMRRHRVLARHGDLYDPLSFCGDRNLSSVSDAIIIELVNPFLAMVKKQYPHLSPAAYQQLSDIQHIRPLVLLPIFIDSVLRRICTSPADRFQLQRMWDTQLERMLELPFVNEQDAASPAEMIDGLDRCFSFRRKRASRWAEQNQQWLNQLRGSHNESYVQHALKEPEFRNRRARYIVYGHTHRAELLPLETSHADGFVLNQMYFNSGTWRRVYQPTQIFANEQDFIATETLHLLAFYEQDERLGRGFETLTGTLGLPTNSVPNIAVRNQAIQIPAPHLRAANRIVRTKSAT